MDVTTPDHQQRVWEIHLARDGTLGQHDHTSEFGAGADAQLLERASEMRLNRLWADRQARRDFRIGGSVGHEPCDAPLLRSERGAGTRRGAWPRRCVDALVLAVWKPDLERHAIQQQFGGGVVERT